ANFPVSPNAFQPIKGDGQDGVIVKLSPDLSTVIWSSFYGGNNNDALYSLTLGNNGNIYVAGGTESTNLPSNTLPFFLNYGGGRSDGFVGKISGNGSLLLASTYVGTAEYDQVYFIESDRRNQVYLLGQTE